MLDEGEVGRVERIAPPIPVDEAGGVAGGGVAEVDVQLDAAHDVVFVRGKGLALRILFV